MHPPSCISDRKKFPDLVGLSLHMWGSLCLGTPFPSQTCHPLFSKASQNALVLPHVSHFACLPLYNPQLISSQLHAQTESRSQVSCVFIVWGGPPWGFSSCWLLGDIDVLRGPWPSLSSRLCSASRSPTWCSFFLECAPCSLISYLSPTKSYSSSCLLLNATYPGLLSLPPQMAHQLYYLPSQYPALLFLNTTQMITRFLHKDQARILLFFFFFF